MYERMLDPSIQPSDRAMIHWIGQPIAKEWSALRKFLKTTYGSDPVFNSGGKRYGWNLQYRIGGRPLCEMYPEKASFTALVILGITELDQALEKIESFASTVQKGLSESPRYHDGCWMYIRVSNPTTCHQDVKDIEELILIKKKPPRKKIASS